MRFASWNVNGIRAILKKDFYEVVDALGADIFAVQETKCQPGQVELELPGYRQFYSFAHRKGYSGTAVFSKEEPSMVLHGIGDGYLDDEGRVLAAEFQRFWFVDVYTPNSQAGLARIGHRMQWDDAFRDFCVGLHEGTLPGGVLYSHSQSEIAGEKVGVSQQEAQAMAAFAETKDLDAAYAVYDRTPDGLTATPKPVIVCGDFNVAHEEIDLYDPDGYRGSTGFSDEEREKFSALLNAGFVDTFRHLHPDQADTYSWWSYQKFARRRNDGWRLDYFLVTKDLESSIEGASIYTEVQGSDHCPVALELSMD